MRSSCSVPRRVLPLTLVSLFPSDLVLQTIRACTDAAPSCTTQSACQEEKDAWIDAIREAKSRLLSNLRTLNTEEEHTMRRHRRRSLQAVPFADYRQPVTQSDPLAKRVSMDVPSAADHRSPTVETFIAAVWVPDTRAEKCMRCQEPFTVFRRRHHCRMCGLLCCHPCSSKVRADVRSNCLTSYKSDCFTTFISLSNSTTRPTPPPLPSACGPAILATHPSSPPSPRTLNGPTVPPAVTAPRPSLTSRPRRRSAKTFPFLLPSHSRRPRGLPDSQRIRPSHLPSGSSLPVLSMNSHPPLHTLPLGRAQFAASLPLASGRSSQPRRDPPSSLRLRRRSARQQHITPTLRRRSARLRAVSLAHPSPASAHSPVLRAHACSQQPTTASPSS